MNVTVAICTWNRAALLDQTLTRMRELAVPAGVAWELLVVNNNCTDGTDKVIDAHAPHLPLVRLFEPKPGLSNARNCAVARAAGDLLLWTDDDVLVPTDWVARYAEAAARHPGAVVFGGPIRPWWESAPPRWAVRGLRHVETTWALLDYGDEVRALAPGETVFGANMGFRLAALRGHRFDPDLGRVQNDLMSCEEGDVIERLRAAGGSGLWVGTAPVRHFVQAHRVSARYLREFHRVKGYQAHATMAAGDGPRVFGYPRWLFWKYLKAAARERAFRLVGGDRWLPALLEAAHLRGALDRLSGRVPPGARRP